MTDWYRNFAELTQKEREGLDFGILAPHRASTVAIIAPHGGTIEPGTSQIASAIAGEEHQLYCFEGLVKAPHGRFHITSTNFDEPQCLKIIGECDIVVAVHGLNGSSKAVHVGGLHAELRDRLSASIVAAGFRSEAIAAGDHAAINPRNICNMGRTRRGVQLEITRGLRDALVDDAGSLAAFTGAVRRVL